MNRITVGFFKDFEGKTLYKWSVRKLSESDLVFCSFIIYNDFGSKLYGALPQLGEVGCHHYDPNTLKAELELPWKSPDIINKFKIFYNERKEKKFNYFGDNIGSFEKDRYSSSQFVAEFLGFPKPIKNNPQMIYEILSKGK